MCLHSMCHPKGFKYNTSPIHIFPFSYLKCITWTSEKLGGTCRTPTQTNSWLPNEWFYLNEITKMASYCRYPPPPPKKKKLAWVTRSYRMSNNIRCRFVWQTKIPTKHPRSRPFIHQVDKKLRVWCRRVVRKAEKRRHSEQLKKSSWF